MSNRDYRRCYVDDNVMFFTDNFEHQWGDDWNDRPYEHNAGEPYYIKPEEPLEDGYGHIRYVAFADRCYWKRPNYGMLNSPYSVEDINNGAVAWLYSDESGALMGGATMDEAIEWLNKSTTMWGELIPKVGIPKDGSILDKTAKKNLLAYYNDCEEFARHVMMDVLHELGADKVFKEYMMAHRDSKRKIA